MKKILSILVVFTVLNVAFTNTANAFIEVLAKPQKSCWYNDASGTQIFKILYDNNTHTGFGNSIYIWVRIGGTVYGSMAPNNVYFDNLTGGWYYEYDAVANGVTLPTPLSGCIDITYHYVNSFVEPYPWDRICECDETACDARFYLGVGNNSPSIGVAPLTCNPGYTYTVDFGDGTQWSMSYPTCLGFMYTYGSPGTYTVCVTASNGVQTCQKCKTICINDYDEEEGDGEPGAAPKNTNTSNLNNPSVGFVLYPVPASNLLKIDFQSLEEEIMNIEILDITGVKVKTIQEKAVLGKNKFNISTENLQPGTYTVKLSGGHQTITKRFSILK